MSRIFVYIKNKLPEDYVLKRKMTRTVTCMPDYMN
jgi:hypothetical protein